MASVVKSKWRAGAPPRASHARTRPRRAHFGGDDNVVVGVDREVAKVVPAAIRALAGCDGPNALHRGAVDLNDEAIRLGILAVQEDSFLARGADGAGQAAAKIANSHNVLGI